MAKITEILQGVELDILTEERDGFSQGSEQIEKEIVEIYEEEDFGSMPKSENEAKRMGVNYWNGLAVSLLSNHTVDTEGILHGSVMPIRYQYSKANQLFVEMSLNKIDSMKKSLQLVNVSLVVPYIENGNLLFLSQLRSNCVGWANFYDYHFIGGGLEAEDLNDENPLIKALERECKEEVGLNLSSIDLADEILLVEECELGKINFLFIAKNQDIERLLSKMNKGMEVSGLVGLNPENNYKLTPYSKALGDYYHRKKEFFIKMAG